MTRTIASLYERLGVLPSCTDSELRKAYRDLVFATHPDQNPQGHDATGKTQSLTEAYAELKRQRVQAESDDQPIVTVSFSFSSAVDIKKVAGIKARLRAAWIALQQQPSDPLRALRFIHAAFAAEQGNTDFVTRLLVDPLLIDLAPTLLSDITEPAEDVSGTLSRWARHLQRTGRLHDAIQILEDAVSSSSSSAALKDELRSHHYSAAQYPHATTGTKPDPEQRVTHLRRIIELGYDLDYIHKLLAEAYHDAGDDDTARAYLERAYELNPDLSGAVRITRVLGLPARNRTATVAATNHPQPRWSRLAQIPAPWQMRLWAESGMWESMLDFAKPGDYSRRILPAARATLRTVAASLGNCKHPAAEAALIELLGFDYYWDVSRAAAVSLSKIGGRNALAALEQHSTNDAARNPPYLMNCISYLRARIENPQELVDGNPTTVLAQAMQAAERHRRGDMPLGAPAHNYGLARFLFENVMHRIGSDHADFDKATALWARSCAEMNDFERAIEIVRPVYTALHEGGDSHTVGEIEGWLWAAIGLEEYNEYLDGLYQWALELNFSLISTATTPEGVLGPLRRLTRWFEQLGRKTSANYLRELIRSEAPGTPFVDSHGREKYVREVELTEKMEEFLTIMDARIKLEVVAKVKELMKAERSVETSSSLTQTALAVNGTR